MINQIKQFLSTKYGKILLIATAAIIALSLIIGAIAVALAPNEGDPKEDIKSTISASSDMGHTYVSAYLRDWNLPAFDSIKVEYFERCFSQLYNYEGGMPSTFEHALLAAEKFLNEYYDNIDRLNRTEVTDAVLCCYVDVLGDPYSIYRPPVESDDFMTDMSGKFGGIGVVVEYNYSELTITVSTVYPESPAEAAGIKVGDVLYAVDGKTIDELGFNNAVYYVRGEIGTKVELTLIRNGDFVTVTATRAEVEEINVAYSIDDEINVGYVQIVAFKDNTFDQFKEAIDALEAAGVDGIIFDLRGNPGGYVRSVVSVVSYLIPDGKTVISYQYKGKQPTVLKSDDMGADHVVDLPFVVLCDQYTASAGEIFTSAIRDYRNEGLINATLVGTTTYKKGIMQNTYYYGLDDSTVTLTVAYYNPPCGINYHGIGITPDRIVEIEGNVDTQYEAAVEEMLKLINAN